MREPHPLTELIPIVADRDELSMQIAQTGGLSEPVMLYEGRIIEGRVRYLAALDEGFEPTFQYWDSADHPIDWMVKRHIKSHDPDSLERMRLAVRLMPLYEKQSGKMEIRLNGATGLGRHTIRNLTRLWRINKLDRVLSGELNLADGIRVAGLSPSGRRANAYYGKGDKFDETFLPPQRYLASWEKQGFEFRKVNPKEAARRVKIIDELLEGLAAARADLEKRAVRPRHTTP